MHAFDEANEKLARAVVEYALWRMRLDPPPLDRPWTPAQLDARAGQTVTPAGLGGEAALAVFTEVLADAVVSADHPRFLAFVPAAPTDASVLFDLVVSASCTYGGTWLEASGAIWAENQALAWLAELAGLPSGAGGVFVPGGTLGNLSALVAARHTAAQRRTGRPPRWRVIASTETHSSLDHVARVMDVEVVRAPVGDDGRLTPDAARAALERLRREAPPTEADDPGVFAIVATAGTTNAGIVDDLAGLADLAAEWGVWLHADGAYGLAALASPRSRGLFAGIERVDSFIVDPHKWLFAPFDCCALVYRDPALARAAHTQHASYLEPVVARGEWNPSDYAVHLTRRARGLPFWFSLATHGTDAYAAAIDATFDIAAAAAELVEAHPDLELVWPPQLSVLLVRRRGWSEADYAAWSDRVLAEGIALCVPTTWRGETVLRFCFVNPRTTVDDVRLVLDSLAGDGSAA